MTDTCKCSANSYSQNMKKFIEKIQSNSTLLCEKRPPALVKAIQIMSQPSAKVKVSMIDWARKSFDK